MSLRWVPERDRQPAGRDEGIVVLRDSGAYLVEIATPDRGVESVATRARRVAGTARFLRSVYVPEDDRWFLLYEGASTAEVAAAVERADVDVVSVAVPRDVPRSHPDGRLVTPQSGTERSAKS